MTTLREKSVIMQISGKWEAYLDTLVEDWGWGTPNQTAGGDLEDEFLYKNMQHHTNALMWRKTPRTSKNGEKSRPRKRNSAHWEGALNQDQASSYHNHT